jgi:hypothetical protein
VIIEKISREKEGLMGEVEKCEEERERMMRDKDVTLNSIND